MSREIITAADVDDPNSPLIGATLLAGEDLPTTTIHNSIEDVPMAVKTLRLPSELHDEALAIGHPQGFSGVVRDALLMYLHPEHQVEDVRHALAVIQQAITRLEAA